MPLQSGDLLAMYTDGVTEATAREGQMYGDDRLAQFCVANRTCGASEFIRRWFDDLHAFSGGSALDDDLTIIALKKK